MIHSSVNFRCHKICVEKLPDCMVPRVKASDEYLKQIDCDPIDKDSSRVEISLDNLQMPNITVRTDCRPVLYRS